ncbi:Rne/Rng family ribonuclease [Cellulomonas dongxiuzhuiae]|uniref:Rne/Rng family ribonuclease n=1 Tax=Cellulomonas dongxiuzhuiae TaxID=2819979 RepID=A0ABX8GGE8_9CELL|nr:Rne/Rng family ribonuclease [Cellulomonas dongxiuzhuiae]QWC14957.1 Rne/Rng family ribonuclease [Cellulomonas dongxiuzhuiae]
MPNCQRARSRASTESPGGCEGAGRACRTGGVGRREGARAYLYRRFEGRPGGRRAPGPRSRVLTTRRDLTRGRTAEPRSCAILVTGPGAHTVGTDELAAAVTVQASRRPALGGLQPGAPRRPGRRWRRTGGSRTDDFRRRTGSTGRERRPTARGRTSCGRGPRCSGVRALSPVNSPENTDAVDAGEAAPKKRRRRVVRDVATPGTPAAAEVQADVAPAMSPVDPAPVAAEPQAPAPAEVPEPVAAPVATTRARRSRRVTRTVVLDDVAAPAVPDAPVADVPAQDEVPETPVVDEPQDDEATAEVAPGDEPAAVEEPAPVDEPEPADLPAQDAEERAPRRRRSGRRGGRTGRSAQDAGPDETADDGAAVEEPAGATDAPRTDAPLDVLAELGPVRTEEPESRARLATTALLFQAPEPASRPRRRRAQSSAGSPQEISEAARAEAEEQLASDDAAAADEVTTSVDDAPEESAGRTRRRRGGRGRKAPVEVEDTQPADVVDEDELEQPDVETPDGVDEAEGDDDERDDDGGDDDGTSPRRRRRRGGRGRRGRADAPGDDEAADEQATEDEPQAPAEAETPDDAGDDDGTGSSRRRRRRRRGARGEVAEEPRRRTSSDEVTALRGSTRLEAKRQRRREGRDAGRRRQVITEAEFLARREAVERTMVVRELDARTQIAVLEDGVLVEHYVSNQAQASMVGNVYLGRVQNVLPSMEAAFVDVGKGRNAVLYAGEVNWDAAGLEGGQPRRIEQALKSGDAVLVQVTKDPIGHKGARLTSQITLAGRYLVYVPGGGMTGISRKLPDTERSRLKKILRDLVPDSAGVIVRTAAEGASEDELRSDVVRLQGQWEAIEKKRKTANAPALLQGEPDMAIRVVRDIFNDDFSSLVVQGDDAWSTISTYVGELAPDLAARTEKWTGTQDVFTVHRVDEQLAKGMDRKVWLPSGGSLVIDRTEAMTVVDVNTGKFTGVGGTLEETVTRNNLEAAEEIVRQLRLRDIGGIIVIDFIDMVLESNRDLVLRRLVECLGRDRTKHQVAEVTSLGLVQMTRKRVGQGLVEAFSETCEHCHGRGFIVHTDPVGKGGRPDVHAQPTPEPGESKRARRKRGATESAVSAPHPAVPVLPEAREAVKATLATIAAAAAHAHEAAPPADADAPVDEAPVAHADAPDATTTPPADADAPVDEAPVAHADAPDATTTADVAPAEAPVEAPRAPRRARSGGARKLGTLDVMAELSTAGVEATATGAVPTTAVETDAPLELHAVAPEVFEDADGEPDAAPDAGTDGPPAPDEG